MNPKEIIDSIEFLEFCESHVGLIKEICDFVKIDQQRLYEMLTESSDMRKILIEWKRMFNESILKGEITIDA